MALLVGGCSRKDVPSPSPSPSRDSTPVAAGAASTPPLAVPQDWLGRWDGPEGTYLQIVDSGEGRYDVTIKDLDRARSFPGIAGTDHLYFERDGVQERIRATDGAATGMKWLAEKSKCLTVKAGEGYCRS